jgi:hypothetical protein
MAALLLGFPESLVAKLLFQLAKSIDCRGEQQIDAFAGRTVPAEFSLLAATFPLLEAR